MIQNIRVMILTGFFCLVMPVHCPAEIKAVLLAGPDGVPVYELNAAAPMIPASTLKFLTGLTALETLGSGYRFHTLAAYDKKTGRLFLKGYGDPLFISEAVDRLSRMIISNFSPGTISDIIIDTDFFSPDIAIPGTGRSNNPYDATTGALCANFNTFRFKWSRSTGTYASAEPQTPFLDIFNKDIRASGLKEGRILLSESQRQKYPGLLLAHFLKEQHIPVTGSVTSGPFCDNCTPVLKFESDFVLSQVVEKLLAFSNNFIANQIMLAMGAGVLGPPATLEKGIKVLEKFAEDRLGLQGIQLAEGSGLSRQNRISPRQMLIVLRAFTPYYRLLRQEKNDFYKTGTLSDVRARAGYLRGKDQKLYPYVIMLNNTRKGVDQILGELKQKVCRISSGKG